MHILDPTHATHSQSIMFAMTDNRQERLTWWALASFVALCVAVGAGAGFATSQSVADWYPTLAKPSWTPPSWLFGPVWTVLYVMMAVAAWLVWKRGAMARPALLIFFLQLALNLAWSLLFFGLRSPFAGLIDIILMWITIVATILAFYSHNRIAAVLLVPYFAWVTFAAALNAAIWMMN
jgi:translocator protein